MVNNRKNQQQELVHRALAGSFFKAEEQACKIYETSGTRTCTHCSCWILLQGWRTNLQDLWNISNKNLYTVLLLDPSSRLKKKSARSLKHQQQLVHNALAGSFFKAEEQVCKISETLATTTCTQCSCWILLQGWRTSLQVLWNINNKNLYTVKCSRITVDHVPL